MLDLSLGIIYYDFILYLLRIGVDSLGTSTGSKYVTIIIQPIKIKRMFIEPCYGIYDEFDFRYSVSTIIYRISSIFVDNELLELSSFHTEYKFFSVPFPKVEIFSFPLNEIFPRALRRIESIYS